MAEHMQTQTEPFFSEADGTRDYSNEVVYPFGYGLSYTTFEQTLDNVVIADDKKTAQVTVTTTNTGDVAGKSAAFTVYAQNITHGL